MKEILLNKNRVALVDDEDYEWLNKYKWYAHERLKNCYVERIYKGKHIQMHSMITNCPDDMYVDHVDGNGLNNQRNNLRIVSSRQNNQNRHIKKTSIYPGVWWVKTNNKWSSAIRINGKQKCLGFFINEIDAFRAYYDAVLSLGEKILDFPYPEK